MRARFSVFSSPFSDDPYFFLLLVMKDALTAEILLTLVGFVGFDGCRGPWLLVHVHDYSRLKLNVHHTVKVVSCRSKKGVKQELAEHK